MRQKMRYINRCRYVLWAKTMATTLKYSWKKQSPGKFASSPPVVLVNIAIIAAGIGYMTAPATIPPSGISRVGGSRRIVVVVAGFGG